MLRMRLECSKGGAVGVGHASTGGRVVVVVAATAADNSANSTTTVAVIVFTANVATIAVTAATAGTVAIVAIVAAGTAVTLVHHRDGNRRDKQTDIPPVLVPITVRHGINGTHGTDGFNRPNTVHGPNSTVS